MASTAEAIVRNRRGATIRNQAFAELARRHEAEFRLIVEEMREAAGLPPVMER